MAAQIIKKRTRFFVAVEGESEQSFLVWLQVLAQGELHIHLDDVLLGGGGFKSMLEKAVKLHARGCKISGAYKDRFLIVDADRSSHGSPAAPRRREKKTNPARCDPAGLKKRF